MPPLKNNPLFYGCMILLFLGFGAEIFCLARWRTANGRLRREAAALKKPAAALPPGQLRSAEEKLSALRQSVAERAARWRGESAQLLKPCPRAESQEVYFDLLAFVEEYRRRAGELNIRLSSAEAAKFGFSIYLDSGTGPGPARIAAVHRERQIISHLLDELFAARPAALLSIRRGAARDAASHGAPFSCQGEQGFAATAFQIIFTGNTDTLRSFTNAIAGGGLPLVVTGVEARPAPAERKKTPVSPHDLFQTRDNESSREKNAAQPAPLIHSRLSRFHVTLEYVEARGV